jgi:energy-coupling factor transporter ATP-binding protein EcfA2
MIDSARLRTELNHIEDSLARLAASQVGVGILTPVQQASGRDLPVKSLIWQALHADCLRIAYTALAADGGVTDDEVDELYEYLFTVARHYASTVDGYRDYATLDGETAQSFLAQYDKDSGPFGYRCPTERRWLGLELCRRAAQIGEQGALDRYERMASWFTDEALHVGHVDPGDSRWQARLEQINHLRAALADKVVLDVHPRDLRVQAFLGGRRVFASVAQAASIFESDPFDVDDVHAQARETFEQLVEHTAMPEQYADRGRMLLVLGDSGAGKTHLLRSFRRHVHENALGFVAYAQLQSRSNEYGRYLLNNLVDSLDKPYAGPPRERTGLIELASGLARRAAGKLRTRIERLAEDDWPERQTLADHVNDLVDDLLRDPALASFDPDLLRVLLYVLRRDPPTTNRALKYLRCEDMNGRDRQVLGDIVPKTGPDDPLGMVRAIARMIRATHGAALVLMVDQAELAGFNEESLASFRRAIDALYQVVSEVPSAVAVIACLDDLWTAVTPTLTRAARDRLENDPPLQRLGIGRTADEAIAIVSKRLEWLYGDSNAVYHRDQPTYPIPHDGLLGQTGRRARDILDVCHQFQERCSEAGQIIENWPGWRLRVPEPKRDDQRADVERVATAWNDLLFTGRHEIPEDDEDIIALLAEAAEACAAENPHLVAEVKRGGETVSIILRHGTEERTSSIGVTNKGPQGGHFAGQVDAVETAAGKKRTPVIVRTSEFPSGPRSAERIAKFLKAGGRKAQLAPSDLRALVAMRAFAAQQPAELLARWRQRDRPITGQPTIASLFELDVLTAAPVPVASAPVQPLWTAPPLVKEAPKAAPPAKPEPTMPPIPQPPPAAAQPQPIHVGTTVAFQPQRLDLAPSVFLRHSGVLGSTGSGKTTLALNILEQLLAQDVPVLLVDRKGDLAGYARPGWWQEIKDPERQRKARALAERMDVRLFTPGTRGGRPLAFGVVPDLDGVPDHERDRVVQHAASALAAMMRLGEGSQDLARRAILAQAIAVFAERNRPASLEDLIMLLESRDDALIARAGRYDDKLFKKLVTDLETLRLNDGELFDRNAEQLSADVLLGREGGRGVPLSIVSTRFLGDNARIQAWVAHLLVELSRWCMRTPRPTLQAVVMLDEADLYMPAGAAKPPSKEPLQDLLKRARSGGLGVMLATQSPGDLDYRSREQINTWFVGKVGENRSIEKLKPLFEKKPQAAGKLGELRPGAFMVLQDATVTEVERAPSLLITDQLGEQEIVELARTHRPGN